MITDNVISDRAELLNIIWYWWRICRKWLFCFFFFIQIIGKFVTSSGLEDNVFQSSMMNSGCIKGVLSESDYKHARLAHNVTCKALEHLLLSRFLTKVSRVNVFATRNAISRHISPMIKGVNYPFSLVIYFAIKSQSDS